MSQTTILVIGATGTQGGAVARALLNSKKFAVRALVRNIDSDASQVLESHGATLIQGDWDNIPAIEEAAAGCTGLFLNSYPSFTDSNAEGRQCQNILTASKAAGVKQVVCSTAIGVDRYETHIKPNPDSFLGAYFRNKRGAEEAVKNGGWESWTIVRGAQFMTNFLLPAAAFQFPELSTDGVLLTSFTPNTKLPVFDPQDLGGFVLAALSDPGKFGGKGIDLAAEALGMEEIAKLMEKVSGKKVQFRFRTNEEIAALKGINPLSDSQVLVRNMDTLLDFEEAKSWGIPLKTFEEFLVENKDALSVTIG